MKKLVSILLVAIMVLSLGACAKKDTSPSELYANAMQKAAEMEDMHMTSDMDMSMDLGIEGLSMDMEMGMDLKISGARSEDPVMDMKMDIMILGQDMTMQSWYAGGYYYMDMLGMKSKMAMPLEDALAQSENGMLSEPIPADAFKEISATQEGGNTVITYVADGTKLTAIVQEALAMLESMEMGLGEDSLVINDAKGQVTIDPEGYPVKQSLEISMTIVMAEMEELTEDGSVTVRLAMNSTYVDPGKAVSITLPDDLDTYAEAEDLGE